MADTETKTVETTERTVKGFASTKRNRLVFFALNLALVVQFVIHNYSPWGLGGAFAIMLLSYYLLVMKPQVVATAARDIPLQLFLNICLYLVVSYRSLIDNFGFESIGDRLENLKGMCGVLLLAGLVVDIFTHRLWLQFIGKTVAGASIILVIWANGKIFEPTWKDGGETLLTVYLLVAVVWFVFCGISCHVDSGTYTRNDWLSNILLILFVLFCITENGLAQTFIPRAKLYLLSMSTAALAWWKVILSVVVLAGGAIVTFDYQNDTMGADALVLCFAASALIILKVLLANYFAFNWVVFLVFLIGCIGCINNEVRCKKTLRLAALDYAAVQLVAILASIWLLKAGLWINLVIAAAYTLVFYETAEKRNSGKYKLCHWLTILSAPAVYAVAYIWHMRFSLDTVIMLALMYAVFAGVMIILHWPHPDKLMVPRGYKVAVCAMMVLLCLIAVGRFGAKVNVEFDDKAAVIEIGARGKNNSIRSAEYRWSTITGETIDMAAIDNSGSRIPVLGEILTITATDSHGIVTTKTEWYPSWLHSK